MLIVNNSTSVAPWRTKRKFCLEILLLPGLMWRGEVGRGDKWGKYDNMIPPCQDGKNRIRLIVSHKARLSKVYGMIINWLKSRHCKTPMCGAGLFTITNRWKQPKCPVMDEWVKT